MMFEQVAVLVGVAAAAVVVASMANPRALALGFGALLPINATAVVTPLMFMAAKVVVAAVITIRCRPEVAARTTYAWVVPLWALGGLLLVDGLTTPTGSPGMGVQIIAVAAIALAICRRPALSTPILIGFAMGCVLSAVVLIMQALEIPTIARPVSVVDNGRFAGFSVSAPFASIEFAIACVLLFVWSRVESKKPPWARWAAAAGLLICFAALLASGGRTGLVALGMGAVVAGYHGLVRIKHLAGSAAGVWLVFYIAGRNNFSFSTLDRVEDLSGAADTDLTSNRDVIFHNSLYEFLDRPLLGPGYGYFIDTYGVMPHFMPLTFAIGCGVAGAATGVYLLVRLAGLALVRDHSGKEWFSAAGPPIAAILLVMSLVEPEGPFMSIGLLSVLCICSSALRMNKQRRQVHLPDQAADLGRSDPLPGRRKRSMIRSR